MVGGKGDGGNKTTDRSLANFARERVLPRVLPFSCNRERETLAYKTPGER